MDNPYCSCKLTALHDDSDELAVDHTDSVLGQPRSGDQSTWCRRDCRDVRHPVDLARHKELHRQAACAAAERQEADRLAGQVCARMHDRDSDPKVHELGGLVLRKDRRGPGAGARSAPAGQAPPTPAASTPTATVPSQPPPPPSVLCVRSRRSTGQVSTR